MLRLSFSNATIPSQTALILTIADGKKLGMHGAKLDQKLGRLLKRAMESSTFTGAKGQTLTLTAPAKTRLTRLILVGIGDPSKVTPTDMEHVGGASFAALCSSETQAVLMVDTFKGVKADIAAAHAALGAKLRSYRFDKYHTKLKPEQKSHLRSLTVAGDDVAGAKLLYADLDKVGDGVFLARDLVTEPPNVINPETLAKACVELRTLGVKVEVLEEKKLKALGMGSLLCVAQGSAIPARVVTMSWNGGKSGDAPALFVGKGVTFDSGGLSLKPPGGMEKMKYDMAGAGAVIGALKAIAGRKAKANVVGVVGLVENMPSDRAVRPGDVVTSMSGQTIEVLNTDAEGRLVLADALWYGQETFKPRCVVNLATLTGAIVVALGHEYGGIFTNDDKLHDQLTVSAKKVAEPLWRFPLGEAYDKQIDSPIADMKNIGSPGQAGSITAAQFLQRFIKKGMPWAHLDIAGMAWSESDKKTAPKGATAYGVRLLDQFVRDQFESK